MSYLPFVSRYDKEPETRVDGYEAWEGYEAVCARLRQAMAGRRILTVECYPGVEDDELLAALVSGLKPEHVVNALDIFPDSGELTRRMEPFLTDDRVRGVMCYGTINDFIDSERLVMAQKRVREAEGSVLVYGFGAALIHPGDVLAWAELSRWECQLRYRKGRPNFKQGNFDEDSLRKNKRGYFVEWRIADRHKFSFFDSIDYYLDTNRANAPVMTTGQGLRDGLRQVVAAPFRLVPYFDPGVWGGQWMKEVCHLDADMVNYAWSFDGVPEENSLYLRFGNIRLETPAMNLVKYLPRELLGEKTFARFGAEFPIRFDFLDTMGGQNLSLQVHPTTEYIREHFGMPYTQDESYYILDAGEDGGVFLGLKEGIDPEEMIGALEEAQHSNVFDAERYVNFYPARKHDHFLIPAGTVHCSSKNCMVLEVSATPYIFTFKLWDWDRVDLNGIPRPIHIGDGKRVIRFDRTTRWVDENLVNRFETIHLGEDYRETRTGLHQLEFIGTHVFETANVIPLEANGEVSMLNLVEGEAAVVESPEGAFAPFTVHYAETFILPAALGNVNIRPERPGESIRLLRANVRF